MLRDPQYRLYVCLPKSWFMQHMMSASGLTVLAGYSHDVEGVVETLMAALEDPGLALLQFINSFGVVQVSSLIPHVCARLAQ